MKKHNTRDAKNGNFWFQCCHCAKWRIWEIYDKNDHAKYNVYGGDSTCGYVCVKCAERKDLATEWDEGSEIDIIICKFDL
ncbi:MAG: hypothetical protein ACH349_07630 [Candidatus Rhabdochlamydia sp.]